MTNFFIFKLFSNIEKETTNEWLLPFAVAWNQLIGTPPSLLAQAVSAGDFATKAERCPHQNVTVQLINSC